GFTTPAEWPRNAVAMTTTHDLPTLRGWWDERDIDWRVKLGLLGADDSEESLRAGRALDRELLSRALDPSLATPPAEAPVPALLQFVSSSPCPLMLIPMEDVAGVLDQPNLPGTIDTHPNWCQRLPLGIHATFADPATQARLDAARAGRRQS
ncbi:MAG: 4-alpha-glucanotransferase, partial [Achromobacter mucicolens]